MENTQAVWHLISQCKCNTVHFSSDLHTLIKVTLNAVSSKYLPAYHTIYNNLRILRRGLAVCLDFARLISVSLLKTSERFLTRQYYS